MSKDVMRRVNIRHTCGHVVGYLLRDQLHPGAMPNFTDEGDRLTDAGAALDDAERQMRELPCGPCRRDAAYVASRRN